MSHHKSQLIKCCEASLLWHARADVFVWIDACHVASFVYMLNAGVPQVRSSSLNDSADKSLPKTHRASHYRDGRMSVFFHESPRRRRRVHRWWENAKAFARCAMLTSTGALVSAASCSPTAQSSPRDSLTLSPGFPMSASRCDSRGHSTLTTSIQVTYTFTRVVRVSLARGTLSLLFHYCLPFSELNIRRYSYQRVFWCFCFQGFVFVQDGNHVPSSAGFGKKPSLIPAAGQEALGIVCERLARFDGDTSWTDSRAMSMEQHTT